MHKIGSHGNVPKGIKKDVRIEKIHTNIFHLLKKNMKIGPVDPEIALLILKKKKLEMLVKA